jgi:hypothetical protein
LWCLGITDGRTPRWLHLPLLQGGPVRSDSVWEKFGGRWMRHNDFFYPDRSDDMPVMKEPPNLDKFLPKNRR